MRQRTLARLALIPGSAWLLVLFVVPWGVVVAMSLATTDILGLPVWGFHPGNYSQVFQPHFIPVFVRSLLYAASATAVCLLLGYTTAYTIARYGGRFRHGLVLLVLVPWFADYLVRIYSWIGIVGEGGLLGGALSKLGLASSNLDLTGHAYTVIGGLAASFLPYMVLPLYATIDQLEDSILEAGRDLYGSAVGTFIHVTLPCTARGIVAGCLLVFLPACGDFATAQLLGSPEQYMIGNLIATEVTTPNALPIGAGLTVLLVAVLAIVIALYVLFSRRFGALTQALR